MSRLLIGIAGVLLTPLALHAQQTITATAGQVGVAYSYTVSSNASPAPITYGATGLPAGLAINASSGAITGIPSSPGTVVGTVSVTNGNSETNSANISITIAAAASTPVITSGTTASGTVNVLSANIYTAASTPAATSYNITGLPAGLTATAGGVISGTPAAAGTYSITVSGNNGSGTGAAVTVTLTVAAPSGAPVIMSPTSVSAALGATPAYTIAASGSPTSFSASGLPGGITVDALTGAFVGNTNVAGVYTVGLSASNASGTSPTVNLTLTIGNLSAITSATTSTAAVGVAYSYTATASNTPLSYNITGLPTGLTATGAAIGGTPTTAGTYSVSLSANNALGAGPTTALTLTVGNRPVVISSTSASGQVGSSFSYTILATNTPVTNFSATGLPAGLSVNTSTGIISGTPTAVGASTVSLSATNAFGVSNVVTLTITIASGIPVPASPIITSPNAVTAGLGVPFTFAVTTSPAATSFSASGLPSGVTINTSTGVISGTFSAVGSIAVGITATNSGGTGAQALTITVGSLPVFTVNPQGTTVEIGGSVALSGVATGATTYQWRKNGVNVTGATAASLTLNNFQGGDTGSYTLVATNATGSVSSSAALVGVSSIAKVAGAGSVVATGVIHPNGNVFDQVLLTGSSATITADPNKVTRMSFIDLSDDIVQVEFSGAGTLTLSLASASAPALATKYNQPDVLYVKGHASLMITGANETTNLSVFSVGTVTAINQGLFKTGVTYDGVADIALISISSTNGKFGALRTANSSYFATAGQTGVYAPGVAFQGPVFVGDISADTTATPVLILGSASDVRITGGDLFQLNSSAVQVDGFTHLTLAAGLKSNGVNLPVQTNLGRLMKGGVDVTAQLLAPTVTVQPN